MRRSAKTSDADRFPAGPALDELGDLGPLFNFSGSRLKSEAIRTASGWEGPSTPVPTSLSLKAQTWHAAGLGQMQGA